MVQSDHVIEVFSIFQSVSPPLIIICLQGFPVIGRQSPFLTVRIEHIRGSTRAIVYFEIVPHCPHSNTAYADKKRNIPHNKNFMLTSIKFYFTKLLIKQPLNKLIKEQFLLMMPGILI